jgi:AraC-like DNA-binding protein
MQKRPGVESKYRVEMAVRELDPDFPIRLGDGVIYEQDDKPITALHRHNCLEVGYWIDGSGVFVAENKIMPYQGGDVAVTAAEELHFGRSASGTISRSTWIFLEPGRLVLPVHPESQYLETAQLTGPSFRNIIPGAQHPEIRETVLALIRELGERPPGYRSCVRGLVLSLMVRLNRLAAAAGGGREAPLELERRRAAVERVTPAVLLMAGHYARPIYVEELAAACHCSVTNFRRLFRRALSARPMEYLAHLRVQMAVGLLENSSKPVGEIAAQVGFETPSSFNRQFRRTTGTSPRRWRRQRSAPA